MLDVSSKKTIIAPNNISVNFSKNLSLIQTLPEGIEKRELCGRFLQKHHVQARLRPLQTSLRPFLSILEVLSKLKGSGLSEGSLKTISDNLRRLQKYCDLSNPEEVKLYISSLKCDNVFKVQLIKCYGYYAMLTNIEWTKPNPEWC